MLMDAHADKQMQGKLDSIITHVKRLQDLQKGDFWATSQTVTQTLCFDFNNLDNLLARYGLIFFDWEGR